MKTNILLSITSRTTNTHMCILYIYTIILKRTKHKLEHNAQKKQQEYTKNTKWIIRKQHLIIKI